MEIQAHYQTFAYNVLIILIIFSINANTQDYNFTPVPTFTYNEDNFTGKLLVKNIDSFPDGTVIVRIMNEMNDNQKIYYDQILLLRIIHPNGSVTEINNKYDIPDYNFNAGNNPNPLDVYPLFDKYILVVYSTALDWKNNETYRDRGMIIDWNGNNISDIEFGESYVDDDYNVGLIPNQARFEVNSDRTKGFLRFSQYKHSNDAVWNQYFVNSTGHLNMTGSVLDFSSFPVNNISENGYEVVSLPFGDYVIIDRLNDSNSTFNLALFNGKGETLSSIQIKSSFHGVHTVDALPNNTIFFTNPDTENSSWGIFGYHIPYVDVTDQTDTNIKILRQNYSGVSRYCSITDDFTISCKILSSTFNVFNSTYHIIVENGFVKDSKYQEQLRGITDNLWVVHTESTRQNDEYVDSVTGHLRLSEIGTGRFKELNSSEQQKNIKILNEELAKNIPIDPTRLKFSGRFEFGSNGRVLLELSINAQVPNNSSQPNVNHIMEDLNALIRNKSITNLSNLFLDIDENYRFKSRSNLFGEIKYFIIGLLALIPFYFLVSYLHKKARNQKKCLYLREFSPVKSCPHELECLSKFKCYNIQKDEFKNVFSQNNVLYYLHTITYKAIPLLTLIISFISLGILILKKAYEFISKYHYKAYKVLSDKNFDVGNDTENLDVKEKFTNVYKDTTDVIYDNQ
ncbi:hypothetical protein C2G38_2138850 [Gigaspora rosea]|uniref:Uncharacterized protein n=1 Tax=Gigaspora rosea TaxID=44941 RepID=A0A397VRX6_9GLOM|nr:hypothetical protein C2G38_2138850 [Gigaspora rosea]